MIHIYKPNKIIENSKFISLSSNVLQYDNNNYKINIKYTHHISIYYYIF